MTSKTKARLALLNDSFKKGLSFNDRDITRDRFGCCLGCMRLESKGHVNTCVFHEP